MQHLQHPLANLVRSEFHQVIKRPLHRQLTEVRPVEIPAVAMLAFTVVQKLGGALVDRDGKSSYLEGGSREAGPRQGLVSCLFKSMIDGFAPALAGHSIPVAATLRLRLVEVRLSGPKIHLAGETFGSARAATAAYLTAMKRADKAEREGPPGEHQSSRSWLRNFKSELS